MGDVTFRADVCRFCKREISWVTTLAGYPVPVEPFEVDVIEVLRTPTGDYAQIVRARRLHNDLCPKLPRRSSELDEAGELEGAAA